MASYRRILNHVIDFDEVGVYWWQDASDQRQAEVQIFMRGSGQKLVFGGEDTKKIVAALDEHCKPQPVR